MEKIKALPGPVVWSGVDDRAETVASSDWLNSDRNSLFQFHKWRENRQVDQSHTHTLFNLDVGKNDEEVFLSARQQLLLQCFF